VLIKDLPARSILDLAENLGENNDYFTQSAPKLRLRNTCNFCLID